MEKLNILDATKLTSPNPVSLVCTQREDGGTNLATVSWWTYISVEPAMIAYAMMKPSYSGEMVRKNKKVVLTIPGEALAKAVMGCGATTGRDTDKIAKFGIEMQSIPQSDVDIPLHTRMALVCTLQQVVETGDHNLYICKVDQVFGNENENAVFAWDGYARIRPAKEA